MIAPDLKDPDLKDIVASIDVALSAHEAFRSFLEGTDAWWPDAYLWSPAARRGSASTPSCDFGRILSAEPGRFACFLWELGGPGTSAGATHCASEVEARFEPLGAHRTRIHIRHRAFSRVGADGPFIRAALVSELGWPLILGAFARHHDWWASSRRAG
jgi:hypothetical protein